METNEPQKPIEGAPFPLSSRIEYVPLALLDLHPLARKHSQDGLESLGRKMSQEGQLQNIIVCPKEGGRYEVIGGAGRVAQAKAQNWEKILASIRDGLSEFQKLQIMLSENEEREAEGPIHKGMVYRGMMVAEHLTQEELAKRVGESRQLIQQYLSLAALPEAIKENATRVAFLGLKHYLQILRLPKPEDQITAAEQASHEEWSVKELKGHIDQQLTKVKGGKPRAQDPVMIHELQMPPLETQSPQSTQDEESPNRFFHFAQAGSGMVNVQSTYYREMSPVEFAELLEGELQEWLESKEGSTSQNIWLPETEEEMREFERLAMESPGPTPLYAKIFLNNPLKSNQWSGVSWEEMKTETHPSRGDPRVFARNLVYVTRRWDIPQWDRRSLPMPKPSGLKSMKAYPGPLPKYPGETNGSNGNN